MLSPGEIRVRRALAKKRAMAGSPSLSPLSPGAIRVRRALAKKRAMAGSPSPRRSARRSPRTSRCQCQTAKGRRCTFNAKPGYVVCGRHMKCKRYSP
jgi:hypothetical protein